ILSDPAKRRTYNLTYPGVNLNGRARRSPVEADAGGEGIPPSWKPGAYEGEYPGEPGFGRSPGDRARRRAGYYPPTDQAYATADAPPGTAAFEQKRAQDYVERKRYDRAIRHYRRALGLDPENAGLMVELGMAYYLNLNLAEARRWLERALEHDPALADAHYMLGMIAVDEAVLQAAERDQMGRPAYLSRSQRRYFTLLGRAVEHFEKSLYLRPQLFRKQFTFFPTRKSVMEYAAADATRVRSAFDFTKDARAYQPLKQALQDWYYDHAQNAFTDGAMGDGEFIGNLRRLLPRPAVRLFLNSWAFAALKRGLELYPEDLTLLKAYEKLLAAGGFIGEQPMSRDLTAELKKIRHETFLRIKMKDGSFTPTVVAAGGGLERWSAAFVAAGILMVVVLVWKLTEFITRSAPG
ncbi:MAG TPA: tetratricopeptide repeat protein, partial [bacterium]|nr:tetratricopeptide repeat protein [bacterium]